MRAEKSRRHVLRLPLPSSALVLLPIGRVVTALLHRAPLVSGDGEGLDVVAVEQDRETLVGRDVLGQISALGEEADRGAVGIVGAEPKSE